ncbi:MAG TPA: molybdenum cofactor guanylyltransferase MobA, partial [Gammaproteobacteria bacterium]
MPLNSDNNNVTAVILAGGAGRRMASEDKGLMPLQGKPLVQHVLERLATQTGQLLINCNRNQERYARFGYPLLADTMEGGLGPLAGLLTALENSSSEFVLSVPCDTPYLPHDLVTRMLTTLQQEDAQACTVSDGERLHPVIMLVRRSATAALKNYLEAGHRKVHDWFYSVAHCSSDFSDQAQAFVNINTLQQLADAERR